MHPIALRDAELSRKVLSLWDDDACVGPLVDDWYFRDCDVLLGLRHSLSAPSAWYLCWYRLWVLSECRHESDDSARNPLVVYRVCAFEWRKRLELLSVASQRDSAGSYLGPELVNLVLARKGLSHSERVRAQSLHMALTITRPVWLASVELGVAGSSSQMQRKWFPDAWLEHLVSSVFKFFVSQLLVLERWSPGFISSNLVFSRDLHRAGVVAAICSVCGGDDPRAICVVSHSEAVIFRGVNGELFVDWRGCINSCVSAWIEFGTDESLRERSRSLRSRSL